MILTAWISAWKPVKLPLHVGNCKIIHNDKSALPLPLPLSLHFLFQHALNQPSFHIL
jgi:hypothetical protein